MSVGWHGMFVGQGDTRDSGALLSRELISSIRKLVTFILTELTSGIPRETV